MNKDRNGLSAVGRIAVAIAQHATPQDLAALDAEINRLHAIRELVAEALELVGETPAPVAPAAAELPNATDKPEVATPGKSRGRGRPNLADERRRQILHLLTGVPMNTEQIANRIQAAKSSTVELLKHPWFSKPNHKAPWELTEAGLAALTESPREPTA